MFHRCKDWLRRNAPEHFPDLFPEECAARLEAMRIMEESGGSVLPESNIESAEQDAPKIAVPIEQKTSGGKKKKAAAEIVLMLGQRKGKKQVTIVYGLDLFGIKLKEAAKAAKRKFATGSSLAIVRVVLFPSSYCARRKLILTSLMHLVCLLQSADNRDVIEIQGSRQEDFAALVHKEWGVGNLHFLLLRC